MNEFNGQFYEIEQLKKENKFLKLEFKKTRDNFNKQIKKNMERIKVLEESIIKGMQSKNMESIEYKKKVYTAKPKVRHVRKPENTKKLEMIDVIKTITNDEEETKKVYHELSKAMKGEEHLEWSLS